MLIYLEDKKVIIGKCKICGEIKFLTKHSPAGHHQPPFIRVCRKCHDKIHGITPKQKINKKYAKGTKRQHKKK